MILKNLNYLYGFSFVIAIMLVGCGGVGVGESKDISNTNPLSSKSLPTSYSVNEGRLLAANCAQCHGTNGVSTNDWDSIAGEDELQEEFYEDEHPLMSAVAHGFSQDEVAKMGSWLSTFSKSSEDDKDDD